MIIPLPSDEQTNYELPQSNEQVTPKDTKQSHHPLVAIPIQQHQTPQKANNTQIIQTRSGRISKPPEHFKT